jgi:hypothetical protein
MAVDQQPDAESELEPEGACTCGHSPKAHEFTSSGKCSFCACNAFALRSAEETLPLPPGRVSHTEYTLLVEEAKNKLRKGRGARKTNTS